MLALTTGTGPGPEGSRPTVGGRRSQGCGAEEGYEGLARNNGAHREHARTLKLSEDFERWKPSSLGESKEDVSLKIDI